MTLHATALAPRSDAPLSGGRPPRFPGARARRWATAPWEDEDELVRQILAGSREHFVMLYDAYFPRVFRFAVGMLRDVGEAEDLAQEVFATVFRVLHTFQGESSLLVWIFGIARNKANHRFRRKTPRMDPIESEALAVPSGDAPTDELVEARRMLHRCGCTIENRLTPLQRRIFHLRHLRRQSIRNIAGSLGRSEHAIKTGLSRMRRTLVTSTPGLDQLLSR